MEELLARTMEVAVTLKLIAKKELTRVIVDFTVQEKAVAHPTDSKLLETARSKVVEVAKANLEQIHSCLHLARAAVKVSCGGADAAVPSQRLQNMNRCAFVG